MSYFLTDLDGTLLRSDASLSDYSVRILTQALNEGLFVSYATARSYISAHKIVSAVPWRYPVVLYNGAVLFDPATQRVLDGAWLNPATTDEIIGLGRAHGLLPLLFALDDEDRERVLHERLVRSGELQFYASRPNDPRFAEVTRLSCPETFRTLIVTYIGLWDELNPLKEEVQRRFGDRIHVHLMKDAYIADHYFLEFSDRLANKKEGLRKWAALVNGEPEVVTVFGDNLNDLGMFETAGTRIAVAGAHPDIAALSTAMAGSNDDDGVTRYLEQWMRSRSGATFRDGGAP
ncbi:HAD-IIB family hydrolase [Cohnella nanjingensis]|uniref:HAD-IIB family hydrolase n=2 Tax=Cohnella nanjingensis TaxID=1387779 RepID=A0A7X0RMS6_9BACL|nr:HAD-IIB family hydrolase [Cohnella nanjingensis]